MCFSWKRGPSRSQPHVLQHALPTLLLWDPTSGQHVQMRGHGTTAILCFGSRLPTSRSNNKKGKLHPVPDEGQITSATKKKELALEARMYIFLMYRSTEDIGHLWFSNGLHSVPSLMSLELLFIAPTLPLIVVCNPRARAWLLIQNSRYASTKSLSQTLRWVKFSNYINSPQPTFLEHRIHLTCSST